MSGPSLFRSFNGPGSFFGSIPQMIKWYTGLIITVYLLQVACQILFNINLNYYIAFNPRLLLEKFYLFQVLTGSFVVYNFISILSLLIILIFFGLQYNRQHGDRHFFNVIAWQSIFSMGFYIFLFLCVYLGLGNKHAWIYHFNSLDLTHTFRTVIIILWGLEFWHYILIPPFKVKHLVILFLAIDVFIAISRLNAGMFASLGELSAIGWGFLIARHNIARRWDLTKLFSFRKPPKGPKPPKNSLLRIVH